MPEQYLALNALSVGYDGKALIRDISIDIRRGEIVALIGPNGAGKSTILKSIANQLKTLAGTIVIDSRDLRSLSSRDLAQKMAVMLTERARPELMTCWDVAASGRYPYTGRLGILSQEDANKVEEALNSVQALELRRRNFNAISDGQRQRVLLARAICQEPEIIVLDEPTSFLDIHYKLELLSILRSMAREKKITVLMSLHEIDLAQKIADRILCVKGGSIACYGTPEEAFNPDNLCALYEIDAGAYDSAFGSIELPPPVGEPEVFVLSCGGTGIPVYRKLQREGIPFCAGILYSNDIDYRLARLLAAEVVTERPFCTIGDGAYTRALQCIRMSKRIIDAGVEIGPCNVRMRELMEEAEATGRLEKAWTH